MRESGNVIYLPDMVLIPSSPLFCAGTELDTPDVPEPPLKKPRKVGRPRKSDSPTKSPSKSPSKAKTVKKPPGVRSKRGRKPKKLTLNLSRKNRDFAPGLSFPSTSTLQSHFGGSNLSTTDFLSTDLTNLDSEPNEFSHVDFAASQYVS